MCTAVASALDGQTFKLANGELQTAICKINKRCELSGHLLYNEFYIMRDRGLHFLCILGLDFLASHRIQVDFGQHLLTLPDADTPVPLSNCFPKP